MEATDLVENGAENGVENNKVNKKSQQNPKEWSDVWAFYNKILKDEDGGIITSCKGCLKQYKCGGKRYGTSTILRHRGRCKSTKFHDVGQMLVDQNGKLRSKKIGRKEIKEFESQTIFSAGKSQLDIYLEETKLEFSYYKNLDVLSYWRDHKRRFPILALMACDVLATPITTIVSESTFSIGGRVFTKYRSSTLSRKIEAQICSRNWLHGFCDGDEEGAFFKLHMAPQTSIAFEGANEEVEQRDNVEDFDDEMIDEI